jgi:hydrogenase maturation protease
MVRVLIAGYGNPLRGDDGLGWHAAEKLRERGLPDTEVLTLHQLAPEMAETISGFELVIFGDAAVQGEAGAIVEQELASEYIAPQSFTHHVSPESLLAAARWLYARAPRAVLFTVAGQSFGFEERLSPAVEAAFPVLLDRIAARVSEDA